MTATLFDVGDNPRLPSAPLSLSRRPAPPGHALPRFVSPTPDPVDLSEFMHGMQMLRMTEVHEQQVVTASVLCAVDGMGMLMYPEVGICEPRRAAKTTSIWAVLLGRCALRPGYKVVTTAQTGLKARERFLEVERTLSRHNVGDYVIKKGAGAEAIEWTNGSRLWVVPPQGDSFRGDAADVILIDEAQEHGPTATADIMGGALALMDTRPDGQVIVAGTAGGLRAGMLWDYLEDGRKGVSGIVEYSAPDEADPTDPATWQLAHPGIGTLTTLAKVASRFSKLGLPQFQREYLGQWPFDLNSKAIDPDDWSAGKLPTTAPPTKPTRFALGYDVAPNESSAALCAAWRDSEGNPVVEVLEHRLGSQWLPREIHAWTRRHPMVKVAYDNIGPNQAVADTLHRTARPRPKLQSLLTREITAAAATMASEIRARTLKHVEDPSLDAAADSATRRNIGDGSWAWGRRASGGDISTLVAATNALKVYDADTKPDQGRTVIRTARPRTR